MAAAVPMLSLWKVYTQTFMVIVGTTEYISASGEAIYIVYGVGGNDNMSIYTDMDSTLYGGPGADTFIRHDGGRETIVDYRPSEDADVIQNGDFCDEVIALCAVFQKPKSQL
jgi:hypothetical protein